MSNVKVIVNHKSLRTVTNKIHKGILRGVERNLDHTKTAMRQYVPDMYHDIPGSALSKLLHETDLEPFEASLQASWLATIDAMKVDLRGKNPTWTIFNAKYLNKATAWKGLITRPMHGISTEKDLVRKESLPTKEWHFKFEPGTTITDAGWRPLPTGGKKWWVMGVNMAFKFSQNPYPGFGYWMLHEQGLHADGIQYNPNPVIHNAYGVIFGPNVAKMLGIGSSTNLKFDGQYLVRMGKDIVKAVNET